ncbi:serine hydrolase domain-containing protein [Anseongella ginsenosidimutans]|nr:serine hydrolase domain-containing protein [Anseongella ginsenosidimutans]
MKSSLSAVLLLLLQFAGGRLAAQVAENDPAAKLAAKVDGLFAGIDAANDPGAAVMVVRNGDVLLRRCYGLANLEHRAPITSSTVFDIASLSKQFAGMAISMLVEEGRISLEDDIRKYIPELPDFGHTITVGHLVHHTSGIRDWPGTLALAGSRMDDVITFEQILNMAYHQQGLNFPPGSEYTYSNTGYNLLAELVARVSGKTFREWTHERIFQPLGMKSTHFHDDPSEMVPGKAYGYHRQGNGKFLAIHNGLTALGSSSLYTSIDDLAKWVMNFSEPEVGGKRVIERMFRQGSLNNGKQISYAFGLVAGQYRGLKILDHSGSWASFNTFLLHFPEQGFSVVVLMNYSPANPGRLAYNIADLYLDGQLEPQKTPVKQERAAEPAAYPAPDAAALQEFGGRYKSGELEAVYTIVPAEGKLMARHRRHGEIALRPVAKDTFQGAAWFMQTVEFTRDEAGNISGFLVSHQRCRNQRFEKQARLE